MDREERVDVLDDTVFPNAGMPEIAIKRRARLGILDL